MTDRPEHECPGCGMTYHSYEAAQYCWQTGCGDDID